MLQLTTGAMECACWTVGSLPAYPTTVSALWAHTLVNIGTVLVQGGPTQKGNAVLPYEDKRPINLIKRE